MVGYKNLNIGSNSALDAAWPEKFIAINGINYPQLSSSGRVKKWGM